MKQFITYFGPLANYKRPKGNLIKIDKGETYLKAICHPMFNQPFCPCMPVSQTPAQQLPQGVPMDIDHQQCPTTSTHLFAAFQGNCHNCEQAGHPAKDCSTSCPHHHGAHIAAPPSNETSCLKEEIKQMQYNLTAYEKAQAKEKVKEEKPVQMLPKCDNKSEKEYEA